MTAAPKVVQSLSFGGGVQSNAILVLIAQGRLPKPDVVIIADTGFEAKATWGYLDKYGAPLCAKLGIPLMRVSRADTTLAMEYAKPVVTTLNGKKVLNIIPAFTLDDDGKKGKAPNMCTGKWKVQVVRHCLSKRFPDIKLFHEWIGFSTDEMRRARRAKIDIGKYRHRYPLIEIGISRAECIKVVEKYGWPTPPRSSCWMCPNHADVEWRHLRDESPQEFAKAIAFDKRMREQEITGGYDYYLHRSCKPLGEAPIDDKTDQREF
ncbi:MAG: hypothetical protein ACR2PR_09260 [Pseudohongiellaceae bacterium]